MLFIKAMAPKKSEISVSVRDRVIFLRQNGQSYREIGKTLNLSFTTVQYIVKKYEKTKSTDNQPRTGRPKVLTNRERRYIIKKATKYPFTSAQALCNDVASTSGKSLCPQTIRNVLHSAEIFGRAARKKPFINNVNREKRLKFAKTHINEPLDFWKRVIFSDETKFNIFGSDGKKFVWRKPNCELQEKNIQTTVKHGGGSVMLWGCMGHSGVGNIEFIEGVMNADMYIAILRSNLKDSAVKLGISTCYYFQQDNDPKHTAKKTKEWLTHNVPELLVTPPQSPDINPIENLWHLLNLEVRKRKISNKNTLQQVISEEWQKISTEITKKLVESMPNRLQAIIDAKGMHTKY